MATAPPPSSSPRASPSPPPSSSAPAPPGWARSAPIPREGACRGRQRGAGCELWAWRGDHRTKITGFRRFPSPGETDLPLRTRRPVVPLDACGSRRQNPSRRGRCSLVEDVSYLLCAPSTDDDAERSGADAADVATLTTLLPLRRCRSC